MRDEPVNPVRAVLMLMAVAAPESTSRVTSAGVTADSSATNGMGHCWTNQRRPSTSSAGTKLLGERQPQAAHLVKGPRGIRGRPAAVTVDIQLDAVAEAFPQRPDHGGIQACRADGPP